MLNTCTQSTHTNN